MNPDVIAWLESPQGAAWSAQRHIPVVCLVTVKDDVNDAEDYLWYSRVGNVEEILGEAVG